MHARISPAPGEGPAYVARHPIVSINVPADTFSDIMVFGKPFKPN